MQKAKSPEASSSPHLYWNDNEKQVNLNRDAIWSKTKKKVLMYVFRYVSEIKFPVKC